MEQRTKEWFDARKLRITGSRVGAILGLSPWQTQDDVLRAMVREYHGAESEFVDNPAVQHGRSNEQRALLWFMRTSGLNVEQCGFFEYGDRMGASPDGLTSDGGALELKVPFSLRNGGEFKSIDAQPNYMAQLQMEMLAAGKGHAYFVQYRAPKGDPLDADYLPVAGIIERVEIDYSWHGRNYPALDAFYRRLLAELDNPEHLEPLLEVIDTDETASLLHAIDVVRKRQKDDAVQEKEFLAALVKMAGGKNALVHGRKLTLVKRQGAISYAKVVEELLPDCGDLEKYRGKASESWRLT